MTLLNTSLTAQAINFKDYQLGWYKIEVVHSNKYLHITGSSKDDNVDITQYTNDNDDNYQFMIIPVERVAGTTYFAIMMKHSGKYFNVQDASKNPEAKIRQYRRVSRERTNDFADNELFYLEPYGQNTYYIRCKHSGLYWNIKNGSKANNAYLQQYQKNTEAGLFRVHLVKKVNIENNPDPKTYEAEKLQHKYHSMPTEKVKTKTIITYIPFYSVQDNLDNAYELSPYYSVIREDYWNPVAFSDCPIDNTNDCTLTFAQKQTWSKEDYKSMTNTIGFSYSLEAGASVEGFGFKATYTASYSLGLTSGSSHSESFSQTETVSTEVKKGSSVTAWQQYSVFTIKRKDGTVVNEWNTFLPSNSFSTLRHN